MTNLEGELPESIIPRATETATRMARGLRLVSRSVGMELADIELDGRENVGDAQQAEMHGLATQLVGMANESLDLLREMVETGVISIELDANGFPLRLAPADIGRQALGAGDHEPEPIPPAAATPQPPQPPTPPRESGRRKAEQAPVPVIIDGRIFDSKSLGLNRHELSILQIIASLATDQPVRSKWILDNNDFFPEAKNDLSRTSTFYNHMTKLTEKLKEAFEADVITKAKTANNAPNGYFVEVPMFIDGALVPATLKKN